MKKIEQRAKAVIRLLTVSDFSREVESLNVPPKGALRRVVTLMSCYNHCAYTRQAVDSYYQSLDGRYDYVLVVLDDCSSDETGSWAMDEVRKRRLFGYVRFRSNRGLTRSWNYGVDLAVTRLDADYVVIANDDVLIPKGTIARLIDALEKVRGPAIVGPLTNAAGFHQKTQDIRSCIGNYSAEDTLREVERVSNLIAGGPVVECGGPGSDAKCGINGFFWAGHRDAFLENRYKKTLSRNYYFNPCNEDVKNELEFQQRLQRKKKRVKIIIAKNTFVFHYKDVTQRRFEENPSSFQRFQLFRKK